jgi:hypothetical protein
MAFPSGLSLLNSNAPPAKPGKTVTFRCRLDLRACRFKAVAKAHVR